MSFSQLAGNSSRIPNTDSSAFRVICEDSNMNKFWSLKAKYKAALEYKLFIWAPTSSCRYAEEFNLTNIYWDEFLTTSCELRDINMNRTRILPSRGSESVMGVTVMSGKQAENWVLWRLTGRNGYFSPKVPWEDLQRTPLLWVAFDWVLPFCFISTVKEEVSPAFLEVCFPFLWLFYSGKVAACITHLRLEHDQHVEPEFQDFDVLLQIYKPQPSDFSSALHVIYETHTMC